MCFVVKTIQTLPVADKKNTFQNITFGDCTAISLEYEDLNSYSEFLKRMDTQTHDRTTFSRICVQFKLFNTELGKQALFHIFVHNIKN